MVTSSLANGPLVLRHELGHSIINVGEEYDGGFAYFGPNALHNLSQPILWAHWLSDPEKNEVGPRVERSVMPLQEYVWRMLNASTPWSAKFMSSGEYSRHIIRFSLSGLPDSSDLKVELDDTNLEWGAQPDIGLDRWHYDIHRKYSLSPKEHEVKFTLVNGDREGIAQLCSVEILEYGDEDEFVLFYNLEIFNNCWHLGSYHLLATMEFILRQCFPLPNSSVCNLVLNAHHDSFSDQNETSYRPTNDDCLMRAVTTPNFCKVCLEGLWLSLLRRVNLIDSIQEDCGYTDSGALVKTLDIKLVPLAQFRTNVVESKESYMISWRRNNKILHEFGNKTRLEVDGKNAVGEYVVDVKFVTEEVRLDKEKLLTAAVRHQITQNCDS